jgi:hypothetical protein
MAKEPKVSVRDLAASAVPARFDEIRRQIFGDLYPGKPVDPPVSPARPVTPADLPPEAQAILGLICHEGDCLEDQPLCPPDPRITCQLIPADPALKTWVRDWMKLPWRLDNAFKGDLLLTPGGGSGVISSLLSQLQPPQHYGHMGIRASR